MKNNYLFVFLLCTLATFSQTTHFEIAEAEMKSASQLMTFATNPNTANYDITYHKLEFNVNPAVLFITGKVTTTFTALTDMSTVTFDLTDELTVSSVTKNGLPLAFLQNGNNELVITLPSVQTTGSSATVVINYSGAPAQGEDAFTIDSHDGTPVLYTLSEPYGARDWWPCKQDLNDKIAAIDVYITAPSIYTSVTNGLEIAQTSNGNGTKTTHFQHNYPIPAYLIAIAVTNYQVFTQTAGTAPNEFPIVNYLYPENAESAQNSLAVTLPIMDLFEELFETYPFADEKYGHAQFGWGGGMEHTTVSFMGNFSRELIAHELAHHWFGNKVTCGSWNDIWINEGFATYMSGLVIEDFDGESAFTSWKDDLIWNITSQPGGSVYVPESDIFNVNRIFSGRLSYNKGAMVVNMLRLKLGDANFFQGLKNFLADTDLAYAYAETDDLKTHLETISGESLTEFFNDWVFGQGYPSYNIQGQNIGNGQVKFIVNQTTSHPSVSFFEMPLPVKVYGNAGQEMDLVLNNTSNNQQFIENVPFLITSFDFDPTKEIISQNNVTNLSTEGFPSLGELILFPNPGSEIVQLSIPQDLKIQEVIFYNTLGQKIKTSTETSWNIADFASGVYFVKVFTDFGVKLIRFLKE
ncbi:M1 family aminopeptidase [Flavobacterium soli]|uniref:M1 family aminopeptidase n=1 Tax=Flavobacterium soli TaxID=344881 RepID=UPI0005574334|nr:M1 family aminopeptidase [Flavobacterium soli]